MPIEVKKEGQRVYLLGDTFAVKDRIKAMGGHWDGERRAWWVGAKKEAAARQLIAELTSPAQRAAESVGLNPDTPAGIVADKLEEEGRSEEAAAVRSASRPKQDPSDIRLTGKGEYKGRTYYLGSQTRDGKRVRCLTLPDANGDYLDFWADTSAVRVTKEYRPREVWDGRRYSGRTRTVYTTLGSIAEFVADQKRARQSGEPLCAECGKPGELVADLEDGQLKHRRCCDIEP